MNGMCPVPLELTLDSMHAQLSLIVIQTQNYHPMRIEMMGSVKVMRVLAVARASLTLSVEWGYEYGRDSSYEHENEYKHHSDQCMSIIAINA